MARRSDHTRAELHDMILAAAQDIIAEDGVAALSTRAIASRIGYTTGTLYQCFDDVGDIVLHVNARTMQGLNAALDDAEAGLPRDPRARIHGYADRYLRYVEANRNMWEAMFVSRRSPDDTVPAWYQDQINALVERVTACFADLARGSTDTTPQQAARLVWASVHSVCMLESGGRLHLIMRRDLDSVIHHLIEIHITAYVCTGEAGRATRRRITRRHATAPAS